MKITPLALILAIATISGSGISLFAQNSSTTYYMKGVPQSYLVNPATQPRCGFYLGLPAVSPLQLGAENSAFSLADIIYPEGDSLVHPLHSRAAFDKFFKNFGKVNYLGAEASASIASWGFRAGESYFMFDITQRVSSRFSYPKDLLSLAYYGNKKGDEFDFSGFGIDMTSYLEMAMGYSRNLNDLITIGARGKILLGQANLTTKNAKITLETDDVWTANSKFSFNASMPGLNIPIDASGNFNLDSIDFEDADLLMVQKALFGNFGLALDLGVHVRPIDRLVLSASLIDLGHIRWKNNTYNVSQDASFVFDGLEVSIGDTTDIGKKLLDTLKGAFTLQSTNDAYTTFIPAKLYLGLEYYLIDQISVGFLSRTEFYKGRLRQQINFSANFYPVHMFAATVNYSISNRTYNNLGVGLALKLLPFNFYLITDNIPTAFAIEESGGAYLPYKSRQFNVRVGFNLMMGCRRLQQRLKDKPSVY